LLGHISEFIEWITDLKRCLMSFPLDVKCKKCGREIGKTISPAIEQLIPLRLEFACLDCIEKVAKSNAITLDSETSWGRVMAELKGRA
jgi:hypothetical protein